MINLHFFYIYYNKEYVFCKTVKIYKSYQLLLDKLCNLYYNKVRKRKEDSLMRMETPPAHFEK